MRMLWGAPSKLPPPRRRLSLQSRPKNPREPIRWPRPPVVQEDDPRLLVGHVVVARHHVDAAFPESLEHRLKLVLLHGEVAVHHRLAVAAGEDGPSDPIRRGLEHEGVGHALPLNAWHLPGRGAAMRAGWGEIAGF